MHQTFEAVYENGLIRPLMPLKGIAENQKLKLIVESEEVAPGIASCLGILPDSDAAELRNIIEQEFEKVNPDEWR